MTKAMVLNASPAQATEAVQPKEVHPHHHVAALPQVMEEVEEDIAEVVAAEVMTKGSRTAVAAVSGSKMDGVEIVIRNKVVQVSTCPFKDWYETMY